MTRKPLLALLRRIAPLAVAVFAGGCRGGSSGPCEVVIADGILEVRSATNAQTGTPLTAVSIGSITINGIAIVRAQDLIDGVPTRGVVANGATLECTVVCEFGAVSGRYVFTVSRTGYQPRVVTVDPAYTGGHGGCPARAAGSTPVSVTLDPV